MATVFAIPATFQEFIFIMKYCTFAFGADSLSSVGYKQKKSPLVLPPVIPADGMRIQKDVLKSMFICRRT